MDATEKQLDAIRRASRKAGFDDPQEACREAGVVSTNWRFDLSKSDATELLTMLRKEGLAPGSRENEGAVEVGAYTAGSPTTAQAHALVGRTVTVVTNAVRTGQVEAVSTSPRDGTPSLSMTIDGEPFQPRLSRIKSWTARS